MTKIRASTPIWLAARPTPSAAVMLANMSSTSRRSGSPNSVTGALGRAAGDLQEHLRAGDVPAARRALPALAGRDPSQLDERGLARATVESVAENTADAAVAPLFWGAVAGLPGLLGYRAVNTLDAMVGYRSARYRRFGWAAARTDDLLNLVPARLTAALTAAAAPLVGGSPAAAVRAWRRDAGGHPS